MEQTPSPENNPKLPAWVLTFERFCQTIDKHLRWPIMIVAILACFTFMERDDAEAVSRYLIATGSAKALYRFFKDTEHD